MYWVLNQQQHDFIFHVSSKGGQVGELRGDLLSLWGCQERTFSELAGIAGVAFVAVAVDVVVLSLDWLRVCHRSNR